MNPAATLVKAALSPLARRAARAYVAGPELADAVRTSRQLARQSFATTVCYWNASEDQPDAVAREYLADIDAEAQEGLDSYVSLKAPALRFDRDIVRRVLSRAAERNVRVHFDSLRLETADDTFALIGEMQAAPGTIGCTLPGRWRRSIADADHAIEQGLGVRVVKGQWADPEAPRMDPRTGYLRVIERLAGRARRVAVATHDPELARESLARLRAAGTPCELELLFGLPVHRVLPIARKAEVPVRFYVPYGHAWLPYAMSQVAQNPRIAWWALVDVCTGGLPLSRIAGNRVR